MKLFIIHLQIVLIFYLCKCEAENISNYRKWLEIDQKLFRIEPQGKYTWTQAVAECKKEHTNLIRPKGDYDYAKLKNAIKHNFKNYSSFWTNVQVKSSNVFHQIGLAKQQNKRHKCNKFDNSTNFKFLPDHCENELGFICEKVLLKEFSSFISKNIVYLVQPQQQFTCEHAFNECAKRQMYLVVLKDYQRNKLLTDYIYINYGSSPSFWFDFNNESHSNCATYKRGQHLTNSSKLGFICQRNYVKAQTISTRHLVLIIFLASASIVLIAVYMLVKCFCITKVEESYLPQSNYTKDVIVTDIE